MTKGYEEDFSLTSIKKGGGSKKGNGERKKNKNKKGGGDKTCYTAKHVRAKETLLNKNNKKDE